MSTLGEIRKRLADQIGNYDLLDQYDHAIRAAIEQHEGRRFSFNLARLRINTVAAQEFYTWPTDLLTAAGSALATGEDLVEIESVTLRWSSTGDPLIPMTWEDLEIYNSTDTTGQPAYYALQGSSLRIGPIPDAIYALYVNGIKRLKTLTASTDTNDWMTTGASLVIAGAKRILARDVLRNPDLMASATLQEAEALAALQRRAAAKHTNRQRAWGY